MVAGLTAWQGREGAGGPKPAQATEPLPGGGTG